MFRSKEDNLSGYIIYINNITNEFQHKDPKLIEILNGIKEDNKHIKYTTYRCAVKLLALRKALFTHFIPYATVISSIVEKHGYNRMDTIQSIMPSQLSALIHDIFYASEKFYYFKDHANFKLETSIEILTNLIWNVFDSERNKPITLLELKQTLLILCNTNSFEQIIFEHFLLNADHNRCVTQFRFESMLTVLSKLFSYIDDDPQNQQQQYNNKKSIHYGQMVISEIVYECFHQCPGIVGLNEYQFNCLWKNSEIRFSVYSNVFDLMKRMDDSTEILHNVKCTSCQVMPIRGLRFKCSHCKTLSLCFNCFCIGYANRQHEQSHRMYEITINEGSPNKFRTFLSKLCYIFTRTPIENSNVTLETKLVNDFEEISNGVPIPIIRERYSRKDDDDDCDDRIPSNTVEINKIKLQNSNVQINSNRNVGSCRISNINNITNNNNNINTTNIGENLLKIIDVLTMENIKLQNQLDCVNSNKKKKILCIGSYSSHSSAYPSTSETIELHKHLLDHIRTVTDAITQLRYIWQIAASLHLPYASTPLRRSSYKRTLDMYSPLSRSIHGSEINKTYVENNKSDLTVTDISSWYLDKQLIFSNGRDFDNDKLTSVCETMNFPNNENIIDSEMNNFKLLIQRVKEIIDDSYSDNLELSEATQRLEIVLDQMIGEEEKKRNNELNIFV